MNFKKAIQSTFVLGILLGSQASFAMKRTNPYTTQTQIGLPSIDQLMMWAEVLRAVIQATYANHAAQMDVEPPIQAQTNDVSFASQTGEEFPFQHSQLGQLSQLAPTLGHLISDLGLDLAEISVIPLDHVSSHTLYLLSEILRDNYDLGNFVASLTEDELEKIKEEAQYLEATALQDFISSFLPCRLGQPFLPTELSELILSNCGPVARNKMREVSGSFKNLVDKVREPKPNGFGLTDTLPELAQIIVGENPMEPVILGNFLYVANSLYHGTVTVIDLSTNLVIETLDVGSFLSEMFVFEGFLYVIDDEGAISVIDPEKNQVVETIRHEAEGFDSPEDCHYNFFDIDHLLYVMCGEGFISEIDPKTQKIVRTIDVIRISAHHAIHSPVVFGNFVYVLCTDGSIYMIDTKLGKVTGTIQIGENLFTKIVVIGQLFYLVSEDGVISVFDPATNKVIKTFETGVGKFIAVGGFFVFGNLIYLQSGSDIYAIDPATGKVLNSINPSSGTWHGCYLEQAVVLGQTLYIPTDSGSLVLVDLATGKFIMELKVGVSRTVPYVIGQFLFVRSGKFGRNIISVIDPATNKIIKTLEINETRNTRRVLECGENVYDIVAIGTSLYVVRGGFNVRGRITRIDIGGYL